MSEREAPDPSPSSGRREDAASLRRKLFLAGSLTALPILAFMLVLLWVSAGVRADLARATESFAEEQRIADGIHRGVMRQLAAIARGPVGDGGAMPADFWEAGEAAHDEIRRYLFRDLSLEQRRLLEALAYEHQRFEVTAAEAFAAVGRGDTEESAVAREAVTSHAFALLDQVDELLEVREADLAALEERQEATVRALLGGGVLVALLLLAAGTLLPWMLHRRVAVPLQELAGASGRIAEGHLGVRVPPGPDRELQVVADAFNRMASSLGHARAELEERNRELTTALDTVRRTQAELIQSEKLSAMGRMAAGVAHELNNPLASVVGHAQLLAERTQEDGALSTTEIRSGHVEPILQEAARARRLVQNVLHFSRRSEPDLGPVPIREVVEVVTGLREHAFWKDGLELRLEEVPDAFVRGERDMLQSVVLNLVENAENAIRPRGHGLLRIHGRERSGAVELVFEDDGPGLPDPERVFEPFFTTKPAGEGTGLGLALVYRFISLSGGTVHAENRKEGGAWITVSLPMVEGAEGPKEGEAAAGETGAGSQATPPGIRVLVVEDEAPLRDLQKRLLARIDAEVLVAGSAEEARRLLGEHEVDAVLSDVKMPGESGLEFYRWVSRHHPDLARHFLFVTGDVSDEELLALRERSPHLFIQKPFDIPDYLARVSALVQPTPF